MFYRSLFVGQLEDRKVVSRRREILLSQLRVPRALARRPAELRVIVLTDEGAFEAGLDWQRSTHRWDDRVRLWDQVLYGPARLFGHAGSGARLSAPVKKRPSRSSRIEPCPRPPPRPSGSSIRR